MSVDVDVVVIGAGAAGIAAGIELQKRSLSLIILEARDRVGGRAWTDRETFLATPVDLGASWIQHYGPVNPMYAYYQAFKPKEQKDSNEQEELCLYLDYDGKPLSRNSRRHGKAVCAKILKDLKKFAASSEDEEDQSIEQVIKSEYDRLVDPQSETKRIVDSFLADFELHEASDFAQLSAKQWEMLDESQVCDEWVSFGYGTMLKRIADQHSLSIRLNTLVTLVNTQDLNRIAVTTSVNDSPIFCRRVVVTIPLGCLKRDTITFEPPLPEWKRQAITQMGFGLMNKLILQFEDCFWGSTTTSLWHATNQQRGRFLYTVCLPPPATVLILLVSGKFARELEILPDNQILEQVMQFLRQIFPQSRVPDPIKFQFTRWSQDPFAFGSYSNYVVHSTEHTTELLAKETADDRVHWAGEHVIHKQDIHKFDVGYVHTAFRSGQRAAMNIRNQLGCSSP